MGLPQWPCRWRRLRQGGLASLELRWADLAGDRGTLCARLGLLSSVRAGDCIMRRIAFVMAVAASVSGAWAGNEGGGGVVYLDSPASLAELRATNFFHYE